jgi:MoxR-like ATPase
VVLTSNRTRELHDALKRRCLYHWIDYPTQEREIAIIRLRAPEASQALAEAVAEVVARLRAMDLTKKPGPAEAIDWARALAALGVTQLDQVSVDETLGWAIKNRDDLVMVRKGLPELLGA